MPSTSVIAEQFVFEECEHGYDGWYTKVTRRWRIDVEKEYKLFFPDQKYYLVRERIDTVPLLRSVCEASVSHLRFEECEFVKGCGWVGVETKIRAVRDGCLVSGVWNIRLPDRKDYLVYLADLYEN
jgi:hypothetical protein